MKSRAGDVMELGKNRRKILRSIQPDIVGMYSTSNYLHECINLARLVKENLPRCQVILGGHHVTARPYDPYPAVGRAVQIQSSSSA